MGENPLFEMVFIYALAVWVWSFISGSIGFVELAPVFVLIKSPVLKEPEPALVLEELFGDR